MGGEFHSLSPADQSSLVGELLRVRPTDEKGRYLHWDDFRFRKPPTGLDIKAYWALTRNARFSGRRETPFKDKTGAQFVFTPTDFMARRLHEIDSQAHGGVQFAGVTPTDKEAERFLIRSLVEEPLNSSILEGAATTREQAKQLVEDGKTPTTNDERMVLNNYRAIEFIKQRKRDPLTIDLINELHRILMKGTLEDASKAGAFRNALDDIHVVDESTDEILHSPPPASALAQRVQRICDFANGKAEASFVHPIVRAIVLHFMLAYEHPYVDGNGRTARGLFYWSVVRDGYWLLEYVSISRIINEAPVRYDAAFLQTETDSADLTYFVHHQLEVIGKAIADLGDFIRRKQAEIRDLGGLIDGKELRGLLNHRQLALLHDAVRTPRAVYRISGHEQVHNVSYLTARSDLEGLANRGFLVKSRRGNTSLYTPAPTLRSRIDAPRRIAL